MARYYDPRDPRFRRALHGRQIRPAPRRLRPAAPARARGLAIVTRLLLGLAALFAMLLLAGIGVAYGAYSQLAHAGAPHRRGAGEYGGRALKRKT